MSLKSKLEERLLGSKFRLLNEKIYKNKKLNNDEMKDYYIYYDYQIKKWPVNPLDQIIKKLQNVDKNSIIADLGCGSAKIAELFPNVKSFDAFPCKKNIVKTDISNVPLLDKQVDIVVCCLSLMMDYVSKVIKEVSRILKIDGIFYLAEVKSRIKSINFLCKQLESFGFEIVNCDTSNTHFIFIELKKKKDFNKKTMPKILFTPCIYKKR